MLKRLLLILFLLEISSAIIAQPQVNDSSTNVAINLYYRSLGEQSPIYTGSEYLESAISLQEGHVFFETNSFTEGSVEVDGMLFSGVPILYDIVKDQLVVQHYSKAFKINLPIERVEYFTLSGHTFIRVIHDSANEIKSGFYDRLYSGKTQVLARREKKLKEVSTSYQATNAVLERTVYYIKSNDRYHVIKSMHSLLSVFKNKKKEVQQYLNKNKIKYKRNPEKAMAIAAEYYDRINN